MAIAKKGRRKIVVEDCHYLWWVDAWTEYPASLHVVSDDNRFHVIYPLGQHTAPSPRIYSLGDDFGARTGIRGPWHHFLTPRWDDTGAITPRFVRAVIEWARSPEASAREVDWRGELILPSER